LISGKRAADRADYRPQTPKDPPAPERLTPSEKKLVEWAKRKMEIDGGLGVLLEGEKLVSEALAAGIRLEAGWFTPEFSGANGRLIDDLRRTGIPLRPINERTLHTLSHLETPPGLAVAAHPPRLNMKRPGDFFHLIVALFGAQDPGNVGGVIRTADYFGADEVWLDRSSADPYSPKSLRGSMGAFLRMPVYRGDLIDRLQKFKASGASLWAAVAHGEAMSQIEQTGRRILMLGGESRGLGDDALAIASHSVKIPGADRSESLNLGVAAGILIYQALGRPAPGPAFDTIPKKQANR